MSQKDSQPQLGRLPLLSDPQRYRGLFVIDFGDGVSVGYLAAEVTALVASGQFPQMQVYQIHRALADGTVDLVNIPLTRFDQPHQERLLFLRRTEATARADFDALGLAATGTIPCTMKVQLAEWSLNDYPFVTILTYPAECSDQVSQWLMESDYRGGDTVEFLAPGASHFEQMVEEVLAEAALEPPNSQPARTLSELLEARQYAVQR